LLQHRFVGAPRIRLSLDLPGSVRGYTEAP
jgi:hypothetical protein